MDESKLRLPAQEVSKRSPKTLLMSAVVCVLTCAVNFSNYCQAFDNACLRRHARNLGIGWSDGYHTCRSSGPRHHADLPPTGYSDPKCCLPCDSLCKDWCVQPCESIVDCQPCLRRCCLPKWLQKKPCATGCDCQPMPALNCDEVACDEVACDALPESASVAMTPALKLPPASPSWAIERPDVASSEIQVAASNPPQPKIRRLPSPRVAQTLPASVPQVSERPTVSEKVGRIR